MLKAEKAHHPSLGAEMTSDALGVVHLAAFTSLLYKDTEALSTIADSALLNTLFSAQRRFAAGASLPSPEASPFDISRADDFAGSARCSGHHGGGKGK